MRKLLLLVTAMALVAFTGALAGPSASAADYCETTCPDGTILSCNATNSCSVQAGSSITCDGTTTYCPPSCVDNCYNNYYSCSLTCDPNIDCKFCDRQLNICLNYC